MLRYPLDTKPSDWKYVSEGGATVVFSYIGPAIPQLDGTVLRLRKTPRVASFIDHDDPVIEYQERCTSRLISPVHLPRLESVSLDKEWVQRLITLHDGLRPVARRSKDGIDATHGRGVLATDLVGGDWIAVEIKPKWGFLPSGQYLSPETLPVKTKTCRYCMHSYLRAAQGERQATNYCPLDLFSGEERRVIRAISSLWDAWKLSDGEVNNLKVFVGGKSIKPSEAPSMIADGVVQPIDVKEAFISALLTPLLETAVLKRISYLQRKLDPFDIEGLSRLWRSAAEEGTGSSLFTEPTMDEWEEFVAIFLSSGRMNSKPSPLHLRYYLLAYLLSATFKDCSVIVRLDYLKPGSDNCEAKPDRVWVIDLDRKSILRMEKWEQMDRQIVQGFLESGHDKTCVDSYLSGV